MAGYPTARRSRWPSGLAPPYTPRHGLAEIQNGPYAQMECRRAVLDAHQPQLTEVQESFYDQNEGITMGRWGYLHML
jgi:hypothetical protein